MNGLKIVRLIAGLDDLYLRHLWDDARIIKYDDGQLAVDTEKPFDAVIANEIVKHTTGFIITDEHYGKVAGPWRSLDKALEARSTAKVQIVNVAMEPDPEPDDEAAASAGGGALSAA